MKIGVSAFAWTTKLNKTHLNLFPAIREHGIEGFEIAMFDPADLDASQLRHAFEANDLECTVCAILPAGINPIAPDATDRKKALAHLVRCVETAAEMGAHRMGGPLYAPIGYLLGRRRTPDEWRWAVECFQALGEVLDRNKMELGIEPVNRSETFFLNTAHEAKAFCEEVAHARVGVLIDTFHANIEEKNIADAVRCAEQRLKHLHVSENDRGLVGSGHVDFPGIVAALKEIGYDGYLMIEGFGYSAAEQSSLGALWGDFNVSPEDIAFQGAAYLQGLLGKSS
ncbi:MAG TPA: sugar phosphate isomerase/epimerase family protein [Terracidiphilus sp.]|nr:sugar phosphate isomerase/epimerase family protein [Terracidiphilus sp.]